MSSESFGPATRVRNASGARLSRTRPQPAMPPRRSAPRPRCTYRWILIPAGVLGVLAGFVLYVRERRRCAALVCRMAGSRITLAVLVLASLVVTASIVLDRFPEMTSDLLAQVTDGGTHGAVRHDMKGMGGTVTR